MIKYKILVENSKALLELDIEQHLNLGWNFHGYTFIDKDGWFCQAIVNYESQFKENDESCIHEKISYEESTRDKRLMDIQITMPQEYAHTLTDFISWFGSSIGDDLKKEKDQLRELLNDLMGSLADPPHAYTTRGTVNVIYVDHEKEIMKND